MHRALALFPLLVGWVAPAWGGPLAVVTSSTDLKALVEAVGGDRVRVESLAPAIHEPHAVEVKPSQLAELKSAVLLVRIGLDHEPWLPRVLQTLSDPRFAPGSPHYLETWKGIRLLQTETPRLRADRGVHLHGFGNTHYWLDPGNARPMTGAILGALSRLAPADSPSFEANRKRFLEQLDARLGRWTQAMAPYGGTRVVVAHETWPYFAERFGLKIVAALEPTPGVPPSPSYLAKLTQQMREAGIKVLIAEPSSSASLVNEVAIRSGARVVTLIPSVGGNPEAGDYLALFDLNIKRLAETLAAGR